jgi:hypothetical protein
VEEDTQREVMNMDRRRRPSKLLGKVASATQGSRVEDREVIDDVDFVYRREARCFVCGGGAASRALPNGEEIRRRIDQRLVAGATYNDILWEVGPLMAEWPKNRRINYTSVRNHQRRHLRADQVALREIVERRAAHEGLRIVVGTGPLMTLGAVLEVVRQKGLEALAEGTVTPGVRETLEAARLLHELEAQATPTEILEQFASQVEVLLEVVRRGVSEEQWRLISEEVTSHLASRAALVAGEGQGEKEGREDA